MIPVLSSSVLHSEVSRSCGTSTLCRPFRRYYHMHGSDSIACSPETIDTSCSPNCIVQPREAPCILLDFPIKVSLPDISSNNHAIKLVHGLCSWVMAHIWLSGYVKRKSPMMHQVNNVFWTSDFLFRESPHTPAKNFLELELKCIDGCESWRPNLKRPT